MTKTMTWVLVAIILIAGGYFALGDRKNAEEKIAVQNETENTETAQPAGKKMAFSELVKKQDGAYKCTVTQNVGGTTTEGTTYINGGMIRGEFNSKVQNINIDSTFLVRDGYSYSWSSMLPNSGYKAKVNTDTSGYDAGASASASYNFNSEQIGDYNCEAWSVDASKFIVPTNITFKEMGV